MKAQRMGFLSLILAVPFLVSAGPQPGSVLTPRVIQIETALHQWMASQGQKPLAVPAEFHPAIKNLPVDGFSKPSMEPALRLLVITDNPDRLRGQNFEIGTEAGRVATVTVPLSRLRELETVAGVQRVELSKPLTPSLDSSRVDINADIVHGTAQPPYPGQTGAGVVVGVVDTGIDYTHDDFIEEGTGDNRIIGILDQTTGITWSAGAIDAGTATQTDTDGHGTHVTGIAAGNGRGTTAPGDKYTFTGIAPEAEILFAKTDFFEDSIIDAVNWMFTQAGSKPCVVNLSLGSQFGPHDGTGGLELALNAMSGPGRIIVAAAGNEGGQDLHAEAVVGAGSSVDIIFRIGGYSPNAGINNDFVYFDGWFEDADMDISVRTSGSPGVLVGPAGPLATVQQGTADGTVRIAQGLSGANGDRNVEIDLFDLDGTAPRSGNWTVTVANNTASPQEFDIWISFNRLGTTFTPITWQTFNDPSELVSSPATADSVLAVGAYISKIAWTKIQGGGGGCAYSGPPALKNIASFSSPGPRRDHVQKPDISAPGMGIASSQSANALSPLFSDGSSQCIWTIDDVHVVSQGTSQASPHVAGTIALMLEADPTLSSAEAHALITGTARKDILTGPSFSNLFGHGKLDAQAAVSAIVPVKLLSMTAAYEDDSATIRWILSETEPGTRFSVERGSLETGPFTTVSTSIEGNLEFAWTDPAPDPRDPWYRVAAYQRDGSVDHFGPVHLEQRTSRVRLWQNAPNPFTASTMITFELDQPQKVTLDVIHVSGRKVTSLVTDSMPSGRHEVEWNGTDATGRPVAAGLYFYRFVTGDQVISRRMLLVR